VKYLLLFLVSLPLFAAAQADTFIIRDNLLSVERIDTNIDASKDDIFNAAKLWIAKNFGSAKAVVDLEDKATGTLIVKYTFETKTIITRKDGKSFVSVMHNKAAMQVDCRDRKIRIRINSFADAIGDVGSIKIDFDGKYTPLENSYQGWVRQNNISIAEFSRNPLYATLLRDSKNLTLSLVNSVKAKDKF
jgi:hypothetical protein